MIKQNALKNYLRELPTKDWENGYEYNSLEETKPHEKNTMRTMYLIRDVWTIEQLCKLQEHLTDTIKERKDNKK